jgi:hypothetical protein
MSEPGRQAVTVGRRLYTVGGDIMAGASVVGSIVQWLPSIAAALGIVWYVVQLRESKTWRDLRHWWNAKRQRRRA